MGGVVRPVGDGFGDGVGVEVVPVLGFMESGAYLPVRGGEEDGGVIVREFFGDGHPGYQRRQCHCETS
jgi:hypothetical protein